MYIELRKSISFEKSVKYLNKLSRRSSTAYKWLVRLNSWFPSWGISKSNLFNQIQITHLHKQAIGFYLLPIRARIMLSEMLNGKFITAATLTEVMLYCQTNKDGYDKCIVPAQNGNLQPLLKLIEQAANEGEVEYRKISATTYNHIVKNVNNASKIKPTSLKINYTN